MSEKPRCKRCKGSGRVPIDGDWNPRTGKCPDCDGTGRCESAPPQPSCLRCAANEVCITHPDKWMKPSAGAEPSEQWFTPPRYDAVAKEGFAKLDKLNYGGEAPSLENGGLCEGIVRQEREEAERASYRAFIRSEVGKANDHDIASAAHKWAWEKSRAALRASGKEGA